MGSDRTPQDIRGFLLPWPFSTAHLWSGESTYSQSGPRAGVAQAQGDYDLVIQSTGDMAQDANINIYTQKAGHVGKSKFVWKHGADALYYGRDGANVLSYWDIVDASTGSTDYHDISHAIGLPSGEAIALVRERIAGANYRTKIYKRSNAGTYTSINLTSQTNNKPMHGGLCVLPNGDILAAHFVAETTTNRAQVYIHRSQNKGTNWDLVSSEALPDYIDVGGTFGAGNSGYDLARLRIAYAQGQVLLCCGLRAHNTTPANGDIIAQYASTDNGGSFEQVAFTDGGAGFYSFDLLVKNDTFYLTWINTTDEAKILELSHAFVSVDIVRSYATTLEIIGGPVIAGGLTNKHFTTGQMSCWADEDGRFWVSLQDLTNNTMFVGLSDNTVNWYFTGGQGVGSGTAGQTAKWYDIGSANTMITAHAGCSAAGRQIVFHNFKAQGATTTFTASICAAMLGGYSAVTMPQVSSYPQSWDYAGWQYTWLPFDLPNDTGHYTQTGGGTATLGSGKITLSCTTGQTKYYESPSLTANTPIIIRARLKPTTNTGTLTGGRGFEYRSGTYYASVYIEHNKLALYDEHGSAQVGSHYSFGANAEIDILFAMDDANVHLWAMVASKTEKQWVLVASTSSLTSGAGIGSARIRFGVLSGLALGATPLDTEWYEFHYSNDTTTGEGLHTGQTNPTQLKGRLYPPTGQFDYISGGMRISTIEGPAYQGDNYNIVPSFDYPIDRVFYQNSPSPKTSWRSNAVGSGTIPEEKIAMFLDTNIANNDDALFGNDLCGVSLTNINFREFDVHRYDASSTSWVNIGTFNNEVYSGTFNRIGPSIICNDAQGPYLQFDECRDWYVILQSGETTVVRKLRTNSEGVFANISTAKKAVLQIADANNADPASGNIKIVPNACTVLMDLKGASLAAVRITIKAQQTNENYFNIGNACIGPVLIPAYQYSRGRGITFDSNVTTDEANDGTQRTRDNQAQGRTYRIAWSEGVDIQDLFVTNANPDYYRFGDNATYNPIAALNNAPTAMLGVIKYAQGPKNALVYLPKITPVQNPTTTTMLNRRMQHALCTIEGPVSLDNVLGDELRDEVMRVGSIVLREVR